MCLVVFQWQPEAETPLIVASNRDEFFARPTTPMHWWSHESILAGRDEKSGGTWMGVTHDGRFALLTNVRDPSLRKANAPSRGLIVSDFLRGANNPRVYVQALAQRADAYEGFNFVCGILRPKQRELWFFHSREREPRLLDEGVHALSNASLNTPWPKVERIREKFSRAIDVASNASAHEALNDTLHEILLDRTRADDASLPSTGVPLEWERALSSIFIRHDGETINAERSLSSYGTRASSVLIAHRDSISVREVTHDATRASANEVRHQFNLEITS